MVAKVVTPIELVKFFTFGENNGIIMMNERSFCTTSFEAIATARKHETVAQSRHRPRYPDCLHVWFVGVCGHCSFFIYTCPFDESFGDLTELWSSVEI